MEPFESSTGGSDDESLGPIGSARGDRSELWKKMALMRKLQERFKVLQEEEDDVEATKNADDAREFGNGSPVVQGVVEVTEAKKPDVNKATARWTKIRRIVMSEKLDKFRGDRASITSPSISPRIQDRDDDDSGDAPSQHDSEAGSEKQPAAQSSLELEDIQLTSFWDHSQLQPFALAGDAKDDVIIPEERERVYENFDDLVSPQSLPVSRIPEEVVHEKKTAIEKSVLSKHVAALDSMKKMQADIIWREDLARKRVKESEKKARQKINTEKMKIVESAAEKERSLALTFRKAREDLEAGVKRQLGAVREHFGNVLVHRDSLARRFNVFTQLFPQPIEMRVHMLRGVKNKLPKGAYAIMLTQYESLGGHPMSWTNLGVCGIGSNRPGITRIVKHPGRYFDRIMRVEDSVFALCPPTPKLRPAFVFVLELFQLASHKNPTDHVVAWTALPMTFENMSLVEGKLRLPMIRGEHSPMFQQFRNMEETIAGDLNHWLCNIYLEVRHLSLQELGATEAMLKSADFELDYINKSVVSGKEMQKVLLSYENAYQKSVFSTLHKVPRGKGDADDTSSSLQEPDPSLIPLLPVDKGIFRRKLQVTAAGKGANGDEEDIEKGLGKGGELDEEKKSHSNLNASGSVPQLSFLSSLGQSFFGRSMVRGSSSFRSDHTLVQGEDYAVHRLEVIRRWKQGIRAKLRRSEGGDFDDDDDVEVLERGYAVGNDDFLHPQQRGKLVGVESIDDGKARGWATAGLEGTVVRRWQSDGPRFDSDAIASSHPKSPKTPHSLAGANSTVFFPSSKIAGAGVASGENEDDRLGSNGWEELRDGRELADYTMSIAYDPTRAKNLMPGAVARSKLRYLSLELFGDLFPTNFGTFDFYLAVFCYTFALWMRIYVHYVTQYLFILGIGTPIYAFSLRVLEISFKYSSISISDAQEVAIVAIGNLGNLVLMLIFTMFGYFFYKYSGFLPDGFSKFFAAYGFTVVLNPYLILLIDLAYGNYACGRRSDVCRASYTSSDCDCFNGDFVKLYYRMERTEGSGLTGAFLTIVIYFSCSVLAALILYEYLVYIHRDGRILDLWRRITGPPSEFFVPEDLEVSRDELQNALTKARRWIGPAGARRKVEIIDIIDTDAVDKRVLGKRVRYVIKEVEKDGSTAIHRQFLMDHDGRIMEIFEDQKDKMARQNVFAVFHKKSLGQGELGQDSEDEGREELRPVDDAADVHHVETSQPSGGGGGDSSGDEEMGGRAPPQQQQQSSRRSSESSNEGKVNSHRSSSTTERGGGGGGGGGGSQRPLLLVDTLVDLEEPAHLQVSARGEGRRARPPGDSTRQSSGVDMLYEQQTNTPITPNLLQFPSST